MIKKSIIKPTLKPIIKPIIRPGNKIEKEQTMIEISKGIYIGNMYDYEENRNKEGMNFINACKHPYWEQYQRKKYTNGLYVYEKNRLICNLIDAKDINYISSEIIEECIKYIEKSEEEGKEILINCNQGKSRSATIGLIYLIKTNKIKGESFEEIIKKYKEIVPKYSPNLGMLSYARHYYNKKEE